MKKYLLLVTLFFVAINSFAHVWEIRVNQNQNGSLTWYMQSYHGLNECGHANSGININGTNYPLEAEYSGSVVGLSPNIFTSISSFSRSSYAVVNTPYIAGVLNVTAYSNNACWDGYPGMPLGNQSFTPPPPPVCTSCPVTSWTNTMAASGNNNGTLCNLNDDYTTATIQVNHLACASITGDKQFRVIFDPSGANVVYGPINYNTGIQTNVVINVPAGTTNSTPIQVIDDDFPCQITHGLTIPGGQYSGEKETTPPVISCPANISVGNDPGSCSAVVNYALPVYSDNCGIATIQQTAGLPSGSIFPKGTTTNTFVVTDPSGNSATCSFVVSVSDLEPPTARCQTAFAVIDANGNASITVADINNGSYDNCGSVTVSITSGKTSYTCADAGQTFPVTLTVVDGSGNSSNCTAQVSVTDPNMVCNRPPVAICKAITVSANANCQGMATAVDFDGGSSDPDAGDVITFSVLPAGPYNIGVTNVTLTVTDSKGASTSCNTTITVVDNQAPVFNFAGSVSINIPNLQTPVSSWLPATYNFTDPIPSGSTITGIDLTYSGVDQGWGGTGDYNALYVSGTHIGGNQYFHNLQNFALSYTGAVPGYVYGGSNTFQMYFTGYPGWQGFFYNGKMTIHYKSSLPANITVNNDPGVCGAAISLSIPGATDNCGIQTVTSNAPALFPIGTTTVIWTATDIHNNQSTATQLVTVVDNEKPVVTCPPNVTHTTDPGLCSYSFIPANASATDNCPGVTVTGIRSDALALNAPYPVGVTSIIWTATDAYGNSSAPCKQTITVTDNENPTITAPANISVNNDAGNCSAVVDIGTSVTGDNCGVASVMNDHASTTYPVGTTVVTWTVTDIHGNSSQATQTITVTDNENPTITAPANISVNNDAGNCSAVVNIGTPITGDNCAVLSVTNDHASTTYPVGTTVVTWTVTDIHGNSSQATQTISVTDSESPKAKCKPVTVTLVNGMATITAASVNNGSTDNCGIASLVVSKTSFNCSNIGANAVTLTVTDIHGNVSSCATTVNVVGEIPSCTIASIPTSSEYTGGNNNNLYLGYGAQSTTLKVTPAANGAPYTYSWSGSALAMLSSTTSGAPVFTPGAAGNYSFTVTTTNVYGCKTTCSISICVSDIRVPGSNGKVYVCHIPPGNPGNPQTLSISVNAVPAHLGNHSGDRLGSCSMPACGTATASTSNTNVSTKSALSEVANSTSEEELKVTVSPNPSKSFFILKIESKYETPVSMKVLDASGRVVDAKSQINSNSTIQVGHNYSSGTYYAEMIQGTRRKVVQLIKVIN